MAGHAARAMRPYDLSSNDVATPPRVLREVMSITADDTTSVPILDYMLAVWFAWYQEDGHTPDWARFRPFAHPRVLPHISLYEQIGLRYRCSLVGEEAGRYMPVRMAGKMLDEAMPPENLADATRRMSTALSSGVPNFVEKTMAWQPGHDLRIYRTLQLPFVGQGGANSRVMIVMNFRSQRV